MPKARAPAPQCGCVKTAPSLFRRRRPAPKDHTACQRDCVKTASPQHGWIGGRLRREEKTAHAYGPHRAETKDGCAEKRCCVKTARAPKAHTAPYRRRRPRLRLRTPPCRRPRALSVERKVGCGGKEKTAARQHANMAGSEGGRAPTAHPARREKNGGARQRDCVKSAVGEGKDGGAAARQHGWIGGRLRREEKTAVRLRRETLMNRRAAARLRPTPRWKEKTAAARQHANVAGSEGGRGGKVARRSSTLWR